MNGTIQFTVTVLIGALLFGCGSDPKRPPTAPGPGTNGASARAEPVAAETKSPTRSMINVSDEIRRACGISDAEAKFPFDSARVQKGDHPVLGKLATCFTKGPLAGRQMRLVGHADPRGETEYNLLLGGRRADNVKAFLVEEGIAGSQIATTSRGEQEARGEDEASWAEDRRVDVLLGN